MPSDSKRLISICIPVMNEVTNIEPLYKRLIEVTETLENGYDFEFVFSDNNSDDGTWDLISLFSKTDPRIRGVRFTKNIGFQESIMANLSLASGDAMVQIDADLQDPPRASKRILARMDAWFQSCIRDKEF